MPALVQEELHHIDLGAGGQVSISEPITNPQTRDRYLVSSLMEEAIASSQLEGAVTTREVAKEMIRSGRKPRDTSEQIILNTYFPIAQTQVIRRAILELHAYIEKKTTEMRDVESHRRALDLFNHRQVEVIRHALKHPMQRYTFSSHQKSHNIAYQTARTDLMNLEEKGLLLSRKKGRQMLFIVPADLGDRLMKMEKEARL